MLYDRWKQIVRENLSEIALRDLTSGRRWTFAQLDAEAEKSDFRAGEVVFGESGQPEFVLATLRAWRHGAVFCPLESGQRPPLIEGRLPAGIAHLKTTSATTGESRLIAFTQAQLAADAANIVATMGLRREWPNLAFISLSHSYGFSNLILPLLLNGIPLIYSGAALPEAVRRAAADYPDLTVPAVPVLWRHWLEADAIPPHIRLAISAGAPLPLELECAIHDRIGLKVHNFYGSSECGGIAYDASPQPRSEPGLAGEPMNGVNLSLTDDGCVEVRSRAVGQTYWPEPDPRLREGVFQTKDLGTFVDGRLVLLGRAGEQINIAGRKVLPEVIENVLRRHPAVRDCVVFGVPGCGHGRGESIVATVALRAKVPIGDLRQHLSDLLPAWQIPREWDLVPELPFNQRGKLSRSECRRLWLERRPA